MQQARKPSVFAMLGMTWLTAVFLSLTGCKASPYDAGTRRSQMPSGFPASSPVSQQLMVKLKNASRSCNAADIAALAAATGEELTFIRPMSGNACVVSHAAKDGASLRGGLQRLNLHRAVEWAEIDAIFKPA